MQIRLRDLNYGNRLFESRLKQLKDIENYSDDYLLNHLILIVDFHSRHVITFKIKDGNHAFHEYVRRHSINDIIDIPDSCFQCSEYILDKYSKMCF